MKNRFLPLFFLIFAVSCAPTVANRGSMLDQDVFEQIKPGITTREEVASKLGSPTSVSTFDEKIWYYIGRETQQYSFLDPDVIKQQAIEIDFDDTGIVTSVKNLDVTQAADASPVGRETPTFGQKKTFLRELLGDLSHPRPSMGNAGSSGP
ncbi:MAG: outer membrane protein assembly factor BamE [Alphaproteobacteria bacterium]|nr:outer membrane protein assembly factor BamE [Alphaproteobacteria bacterium]